MSEIIWKNIQPTFKNIENIDISQKYIKRIFENIQINRNLKIIWDIGHGAAGNIMPPIIAKMSNRNILINAEIITIFKFIIIVNIFQTFLIIICM